MTHIAYEILDPNPVLTIRNLKLYNLYNGTKISLNDLGIDVSVSDTEVYHYYKLVQYNIRKSKDIYNNINEYIDNILKNSIHKCDSSNLDSQIYWFYDKTLWAVHNLNSSMKLLFNEKFYSSIYEKFPCSWDAFKLAIKNRFRVNYKITDFDIKMYDNTILISWLTSAILSNNKLVDYTGYDEIKNSWK